MATCGIKKYDDLPGRVGTIDVDYLRWRLHRCDHPSFISKIPLIGKLFCPVSDKKARQDIISLLERAAGETE